MEYGAFLVPYMSGQEGDFIIVGCTSVRICVPCGFVMRRKYFADSFNDLRDMKCEHIKLSGIFVNGQMLVQTLAIYPCTVQILFLNSGGIVLY